MKLSTMVIRRLKSVLAWLIAIAVLALMAAGAVYLVTVV